MSEKYAHRRSPLGRATDAHTALVLFAKIEELAETPELSGYGTETQAIIRSCKTAKARCLRDYDRAVSQAGDQARLAPLNPDSSKGMKS